MAKKITRDQFEELGKCMADVAYFVTEYCYLRHTVRGRVKWDHPYDYQTEGFRALQANEDVFVLKSRRIGASWMACAFVLWRCMFHPDLTALLLSRKEFYAKGLLRRIRFMIRNMPPWLRPTIGIDTQAEISFIFQNGDDFGESNIISLTTTDESGRGEDAAIVFMDEAAFIPGADDTWSAVGPTASFGGQRVVVSCVTKDTYIYTDKGIKQVGDFTHLATNPGFNEIDEEMYILGRDGLKKVSHIYDSGVTETVKITLGKSVNLECTELHPIWARREEYEGWIKAGDLRPDDYVAVARKPDVFGDFVDLSGFKPKARVQKKTWFPPARITWDLAYLIGLIIGDGYVGKRIVNITTLDKEISDFLLSSPCGLNFVREKDGIHYRKASTHFVEFLEWLGYDRVKANRKRIPKRILEMPEQYISAFLCGLFDADGTISRKDGGVQFVSSSKALVDDVRAVLLDFGIVASVRYHLSMPTKKVKVSSPQWRIALNSCSAEFHRRIGFRIRRKQDGYLKVPTRGIGYKDTIPYSTHLVREIRQKLPNLTRPELRDLSIRRRKLSGHILWKNDARPGRKMAYRTAEKILRLYSDGRDRNAYRELTRLCRERYRWLQVKSIEPGVAHTYDFCIPEGHNYYANGILTHNTPNGVGGFFHRVVTECQHAVENGFRLFTAHWKRDCGLSDAWYKKATAGMSQQKILQEFELVFLSSGRPFFDLLKLEQCYKPLDLYPEMAEVAIRTEVSYSGVDASEGHARSDGSEPDFHSITVLNDIGIQILGWNDNKMSLAEFAGQTKDTPEGRVEIEGVPSMIHREHPGMMAIESWGPGDVVINRHKVPDDATSEMIARRTTNSSKMRMLNALRMGINDLDTIITDPFTYHCFQMFEDQTAGAVEKAGAKKGFKDDAVITYALAYGEWRRAGGRIFDLRSLVEDGDNRRVIALRREDDLPKGALPGALEVGRYIQGPVTNQAMDPGETARRLDDFDAIRSGRARMRPPGM